MKVTIQNKKGLSKDLKINIDKKTMNSYMEEKYEEVKKNVVMKGFRPGKVPREVLKRQFGKAIYGEVLDKVLKDTSSKALSDNKIKPAGQPKIDLKTYGEDKDLEYIISVTEFPKVELNALEKIKVNEYSVKIENSETDKRIKEIAKNQKNFVEVDPAKVANEGDLVVFDYKATVDGKSFKGNEGKNTQLELGKDLFIKGFDKQLLRAKKNETIKVTVTLPENFPEKELVNKKADFECKIIAVKKAKEVKIDDELAKNLGAKDLADLKKLITKQINDEYKNSLDMLTKNQILKELEKFNLSEIPENLIEDEIRILSQGLKGDELEKKKNILKQEAKKRVKIGIILNQFGEQNNIKVEENEIQNEIKKQIQMMPGQEKRVMDSYQKNPSALASIRGNVYEEKIISTIKGKIKINKKDITKSEAEKILKEEHDKIHDRSNNKEVKTSSKKATPTTKKISKIKKVSKK